MEFQRDKDVAIAYRGGEITGMAVDDIRGFLYIADGSKHQILIYCFDKRAMKKNN